VSSTCIHSTNLDLEDKVSNALQVGPGIVQIKDVKVWRHQQGSVVQPLVFHESFDRDEEQQKSLIDDSWYFLDGEARVTDKLLSRANSYLVSIHNGAMQLQSAVMPLPED